MFSQAFVVVSGFLASIRERGIPLLSNCHNSCFKLHRVQTDKLETMKLRHSTIQRNLAYLRSF